MKNVFPIRPPEVSEFDQRLESLELRLADVRQFKSLSSNQKANLLLANRISAKETFGRIYDEAAEAYEWACRKLT